MVPDTKDAIYVAEPEFRFVLGDGNEVGLDVGVEKSGEHLYEFGSHGSTVFLGDLAI